MPSQAAAASSMWSLMCNVHDTGWLQERLEQLYKSDPGYSDKASSLFTLDLQSPQELPDNLRGEQWNFVQLPLSALLEELSQVTQVKQAVYSIRH